MSCDRGSDSKNTPYHGLRPACTAQLALVALKLICFSAVQVAAAVRPAVIARQQVKAQALFGFFGAKKEVAGDSRAAQQYFICECERAWSGASFAGCHSAASLAAADRTVLCPSMQALTVATSTQMATLRRHQAPTSALFAARQSPGETLSRLRVEG